MRNKKNFKVLSKILISCLIFYKNFYIVIMELISVITIFLSQNFKYINKTWNKSPYFYLEKLISKKNNAFIFLKGHLQN